MYNDLVRPATKDEILHYQLMEAKMEDFDDNDYMAVWEIVSNWFFKGEKKEMAKLRKRFNVTNQILYDWWTTEKA